MWSDPELALDIYRRIPTRLKDSDRFDTPITTESDLIARMAGTLTHLESFMVRSPTASSALEILSVRRFHPE